MRKLLIGLILLLAMLTVSAQIDVTRVEQYKTKVGWRLYFLTSNPYMWPLTDFSRWELVLSDEMLGYHPPYIGAQVTASDQNYTDPEFTEFAPLPAGLYYYRLMLFNSAGLVSQTPQLTFIIGNINPYQFIVPYVCEYDPFHTAIVLESKEPADIIVEVYDESNNGAGAMHAVDGLKFLWLADLTDSPTFTGSLKFSSMTPFRYTVMVLDGSVAAITYTGGVQ